MTNSKQVLYCRCQYANVVPKKVKDEVLKKLVEHGEPFQSVPDLCEMSARKDATLAQICKHDNLHIIACFPRAVKALFHAADLNLPEDQTVIHNMRNEEAVHIIESLIPENGSSHSEKV